MSSFEEAVQTRLRLVSDSRQPPVTDLEYYAKPENYTGADHSLQQFMFSPHRLPPSSRAPEVARRDATPPLGGPLIGNFVGDEAGATKRTARHLERVRVRRASVQISSRRGSIQLQISSTRRIATGGEGRWTTADRIQNPTRPAATELVEVDPAMTSREVRWREAVNRIRKPSAISSGSLDGDQQIKGARDRFRHAIKTVVILLKWISSMTEKEENDKEYVGQTFTDIASDAFVSDELKDTGLSFDVSHFKANREINISNEVKSILSIPSHARTPEQLQTALYGLQHLKSFAEYPLHMQEKLCKVAWFQEIPPKRIIIRQGHYAENFYFILSGQAMVRILEKNPKTGEPQLRTATIMRKGTSFGELALLHHSRRTATVVSQDTIQLLTIGRDDFFDIFMGGNAPGEIPEHIKFCSSLDFMKDWPIEKLLENPQCCLFHFFKRGVVIVKDSNQSDWLYIIKSGSCRVIKELKGVVPRLDGLARKKASTEESSPSMSGMFSADIVPKVDTGLRRPHTRARTGRTPTPIRKARIEYQQLLSKSDNTSPNVIQTDGKENSRLDSSNDQDKPQSGFSDSKFKRYPRVQEAHFRKPKVGQSRVRANHLKDNQWALPESLDKVKDESLLVKQGALRGPVFVQVDVLKPKDVFGLATIKFDEDTDVSTTSLSLVSNGAECIMFSKRFFMQHADEKVKRVVRNYACRYPSEPALQENLQIKVDWELYKKKLIREVLKNRRIKSLAIT